MALEDEVVKWLDGMIKACQDFRAVFEPGEAQFISEERTQAAEAVESPLEKIRAQENVQPADFETLKNALNSPNWPEAVNKNLICDPNSEKDKIERSRGILELMVEENLKGLKILDYGCGEGHVAFTATEYEVEMSVGYDSKSRPNWEKFEQRPDFLITDSFDETKQNGPYDVIIMFDVIDHLNKETPVEVLNNAKNLLKPGGKIYMRCHPFTSRHATHLYHDINKAYVHLVFTESELRQMVPHSELEEPNSGVIKPIATYNQFIEDAGLTVLNRRDVREAPEEFFKTPQIAERIKSRVGFNEFPSFQLSLQFIDYCLVN